jgi:prevent-host-death family protein
MALIQERSMNITVADMKANLSEILRKAASGEDVEITRHGKPYVRIVAARSERPLLPKVGAFEGQFELPDNWDEIPTGMEQYS